VDDRLENLLALSALLEPLELTLVTEPSGAGALRRILEREFACVLLDLQMPGMDGIETARCIKERERSRHTPILFLTAHDARPEVIAEVYAAGAVDFIAKPLNADVVRAKVRTFAELYQQRREVERQARELRAAESASRAKDAFLATMSHELRTPINAILGYADLLGMEIKGRLGPDQREYVARTATAARHLAGLVDDVLDLAKIQADQMSVAHHVAPLRETVASALALVAPQAEARGLELAEESTCPESASFLGDEARVRQVLANLLSNAVKFTPAGGRVTIRCRSGGDDFPRDVAGHGRWLCVDVEDTGVGIAPQDRERIFEPFVQVDGTNTREHGGTGLGLAISRSFARLMGGDLTTSARGRGGSMFTLWLPAAPARGREYDRSPMAPLA
jgi:signal transduction histidine kinase